jgi:hypothetical protein
MKKMMDNGAWVVPLSACCYVIFWLVRSMVTHQKCMLIEKVITVNIYLNVMARQEGGNVVGLPYVRV